LVGCSGGAKSPGVTDTEILVGTTSDLSGPVKELGGLITKGEQLYFDHINAQGGVHGRQVKLLVEDAQYNPQKTVVAVKKLIEKEQVFCLFATLGSSHTEAVRSLLVEEKIPLIAPESQSGTMSDMSRPGSKYLFSTELGYNQQGRIMVDWILKQNPDAKIGIIYQDDDYGQNAVDGVMTAEEKHGITIQKESFQRGTTDFTGQVSNVMKGDCDYVLIAAIVKEPIIIMKTAAALRYKPQFMGFGPTMDHRVALAAGAAGEGFIAASVANMWSSDHPSAIEYREICEANNVPQKMRGMYHFYGFTAGQVLIEGLKRAGKTLTRKSLIKGMESIKNWEGTGLPSLTWGPNDRAGAGELMLIQIENGVQTPITGWLK
jgi:branched-chain amino acid transport system substrate-binding protein